MIVLYKKIILNQTLKRSEMIEQEIKEGNKLISIFMGVNDLSNYKKSGVFDMNGIEIIEGHIISANGYNSNPKEGHFHCVEYEDGVFGSDIYSDFEPLSRYQKIEVLGHATEYIHLVESRDYSGNLPSGIKETYDGLKYHAEWNWLMPVVEKIESLHSLHMGYYLGIEITQGYVKVRGVGFTGDKIFRNTSIEGGKMNALWLAIVDFIKWYNEHAKNNAETTGHELNLKEI